MTGSANQRYASASELSELTTIAEAGAPGYAVPVSFGIFVPRKTPAAIIAVLNGQLQKLINDPRAKVSLASRSFEARPSTPAELTKISRRRR